MCSVNLSTYLNIVILRIYKINIHRQILASTVCSWINFEWLPLCSGSSWKSPICILVWMWFDHAGILGARPCLGQPQDDLPVHSESLSGAGVLAGPSFCFNRWVRGRLWWEILIFRCPRPTAKWSLTMSLMARTRRMSNESWMTFSSLNDFDCQWRFGCCVFICVLIYACSTGAA